MQAVAQPVRNAGEPAILIRVGDVLVLESAAGRAEVRLKPRLTGAAYTWRFVAPSGQRTQGSGRLYERYVPVPGTEGSVVVDAGGQIVISAGPFQIEWSDCSFASGWVYPSAGYRATLVEGTPGLLGRLLRRI